ncbi:MAG: ATP-binding cassette domain-containing protein [Bacteroidia bacterium]|nr:ATP-binding cassette domain-containing protein [Bacteroidia bacterium]
MFVNIQSLTKTYGTQKAIDNVSFSIEKGEILGFVGKNGAGKTTTMKIMTCFIPPSSGTVSIGEYNIHEHPLEIRRRVGYLPEHNPLYLDMYVHEFLLFSGEIQGMDRRTLRNKRIPEVIEMTGLGREQHKKIGMLSKGYRQRVGLSQAMIHNPEVLILDEPTTGLDPNQIVDIRNLIKEAGKDKTVIFSSHILSEVEAISKRVVVINHGKVIANDSPEALRNLKVENREKLIYFSADRPGFDTKVIRTSQGVIDIKARTDTDFIIQTEQTTDIRKLLFQECVRQGYFIMNLQEEIYSLEDIFRKITV